MAFLHVSISSGILIAVIYLVRHFSRRRIPHTVFTLLWGVVLLRLLMPFEIPAPTSFFNLFQSTLEPAVNTNIQNHYAQMDITQSLVHMPTDEEIIRPNVNFITEGAEFTYYTTSASVSMPSTSIPATTYITTQSRLSAQNTLLAIWLAGISLGVILFTREYVKWRKVFADSLPIPPCNETITRWLTHNHLSFRKIRIRTSDKAATPLTYGVLRPVILLPKATDHTDYTDPKTLSLILTHELAHIKRFDALTKIVAAAVLCLHWFNPLVWLMYLTLNKDMEMAADEAVIQLSNDRIVYARMLIRMAESKNRLSSNAVYSGFSKYLIEERINLIMKTKKISRMLVAIVLILTFAATAVFATSAEIEITPEHTHGIPITRINHVAWEPVPDDGLISYEDAALIGLDAVNSVWGYDMLSDYISTRVYMALEYEGTAIVNMPMWPFWFNGPWPTYLQEFNSDLNTFVRIENDDFFALHRSVNVNSRISLAAHRSSPPLYLPNETQVERTPLSPIEMRLPYITRVWHGFIFTENDGQITAFAFAVNAETGELLNVKRGITTPFMQLAVEFGRLHNHYGTQFRTERIAQGREFNENMVHSFVLDQIWDYDITVEYRNYVNSITSYVEDNIIRNHNTLPGYNLNIFAFNNRAWHRALGITTFGSLLLNLSDDFNIKIDQAMEAFVETNLIEGNFTHIMTPLSVNYNVPSVTILLMCRSSGVMVEVSFLLFDPGQLLRVDIVRP